MLLNKYKRVVNPDIVRKILESHNCFSSANFFAMKCSSFTYNVHYYMNTGKYLKALSFLRGILKELIGRTRLTPENEDRHHEDAFKTQIRGFIKLMHDYAERILRNDTSNAEKFFKYFFNNTTYLNFELGFYQAVLSLFHRKHADLGVQQAVLRILSKAELFVDRFLTKFAPNNKSIMRKKPLMIYFSSLLVSNYYDYFAFDKLNAFLLLFEKNTNLFRELKNLFFIMNHSRDPRLSQVKVNILGLFRDYNQAVQKSLAHGLEDLAIKWASRPPKDSVKKKLWKKIALHMKKTDNKKVQDLLRLKQCPIKIEDIMGDFDQNADIEEYKEVTLTSSSRTR